MLRSSSWSRSTPRKVNLRKERFLAVCSSSACGRNQSSISVSAAGREQALNFSSAAAAEPAQRITWAIAPFPRPQDTPCLLRADVADERASFVSCCAEVARVRCRCPGGPLSAAGKIRRPRARCVTRPGTGTLPPGAGCRPWQHGEAPCDARAMRVRVPLGSLQGPEWLCCSWSVKWATR